MTPDCVATVRAKVGGVFSEADVEDMLARVAGRAIRAAKDAPSLSQREAISTAMRELTHEEIFKALLKKRVDLYTERAAEKAGAHVDAMPAKMTGEDRLAAAAVGSARLGRNLGFSTEAEGVGHSARLVVGVARQLQEAGLWHRMVNWYGVPDQAFPRLVARELARLNGDGSVDPTGDKGAEDAARIIAQGQRAAVKMMNDAGAWIGDLKGYVARQSHDRGKITGGYWRELPEVMRVLKGKISWREAQDIARTRAFGAWRDFIMPLLHDRIFEGLDERDFDLEQARNLQAKGTIKDAGDPRELMMYEVWHNIVTGQHSLMSGADDMAEYRPSGSSALAKAISRPRVLHFKGPDAWMDYNDRYGTGGLFKTVMHQLDSAGKNTALMTRWGPSPERGWEFQQKRLAAQAKARGDTLDEERILNSSKLKAAFENINGRGDAPENLRLAQTMKALRTWEVLAKLGGVVLSKVSDLPIAGFTMQRAGGSFFDGVKGDLAGLTRLGSAGSKQAADALDVAYRQVMAELAGQYYTTDGIPGLGSYLGGLMMRINAFDGMNNLFRKGFGGIYSRFLAQEAEKGWDGLNIGTRESFDRFAISPEDWEAVRHDLPELDGKRYFTLDHTEALAKDAAAKAGLDPDAAGSGFAGPDGAFKPGETPDPEALAAASAADERHAKFTALIQNALDDSISHPRARESAWLTGGARAGTPLGEALRAFTQFKGFVTKILFRDFYPMVSGGLLRGGYAGQKPPALIAGFFASGLAAGYLSMSLKALARGELPRNPFGPDVKKDATVWMAAMSQFGGLGIYGDFLFGEQNRAGADFGFGALAGPLASDGEMIAKVVYQAIHGGAISEKTGRSQIPGELVRLGTGLTPFANLFYARLAFDYLLQWRMQEAVSPGFLQRSENRVEKDGGKFWLRPTSAAHPLFH